MFMTGLVFSLLLPSFLPPMANLVLMAALCLGLMLGRLGWRYVVLLMLFVLQLARLTDLARSQWPEGFTDRVDASVHLLSARYQRGQGYGEAELLDGPYPGKIQLAWSQQQWQPLLGQTWQLPLKLSSFYTTPGSRDMMLYRMGKGWVGKARVQRGTAKLQSQAPLNYVIRDRWAMSLDNASQAGRWLGQGMLLGTAPDWGQTRQAALENSGLGHLFSPSGLHLGMAAALIAWLLPSAGRLLGGRIRVNWLVPLGVIALWWVLPAKLPIARATLGFLGWLWNRQTLRMDRWSLFCAVFALCLLIWPAAGSQSGTGLSFGAVGWILVATRCRVHPLRRAVAVLLGLSASGVLFGLGGGVLAPLSNAIWVTGLSLMGAPALIWGLVFDHWPAWNAFAGGLLSYLDWLPSYGLSKAQGFALAVTAVGLLWPVAWLGHCVTLIWLGQPVPQGLWLYSVGAGQAMRFSHAGQHWLIDTAPAQPAQLGAIGWELLPALRAQGVRRLDKVLLSHGDADHAGGILGLQARIPIDQVLTGEPDRTPGRACFRGQRWQVGEWTVQVHWGGPPKRKNEASCVVSLSGPSGRVLMLGDSPRKQQWLRAQADGDIPRADIVVAAHHGARDGFSRDLAAAQSPEHVIFSQGKGHRWGHPHSEVVDGWRSIGAQPWSLGQSGSLYIDLDADSLSPQPMHSVSPWTLVSRKIRPANYAE